MKFQLFEIDTSFTMRFIFCTQIEMLSIQKQEDMKIVKSNQNIFYFELGIKPNYDIYGITVSMWKDTSSDNIHF